MSQIISQNLERLSTLASDPGSPLWYKTLWFVVVVARYVVRRCCPMKKSPRCWTLCGKKSKNEITNKKSFLIKYTKGLWQVTNETIEASSTWRNRRNDWLEPGIKITSKVKSEICTLTSKNERSPLFGGPAKMWTTRLSCCSNRKGERKG